MHPFSRPFPVLFILLFCLCSCFLVTGDLCGRFLLYRVPRRCDRPARVFLCRRKRGVPERSGYPYGGKRQYFVCSYPRRPGICTGNGLITFRCGPGGNHAGPSLRYPATPGHANTAPVHRCLCPGHHKSGNGAPDRGYCSNLCGRSPHQQDPLGSNRA